MRINKTDSSLPRLKGDRTAHRFRIGLPNPFLRKLASTAEERTQAGRHGASRSLTPPPSLLAGLLALAVLPVLTGCGKKESAGISPRTMADGLFAVMSADRAVYTREVVNRLQNDEKVIKASEHWKDDKALPLPAQMFRMGSEEVTRKNAGFSYALLSLWPINKQNLPKTDIEKTGLQFVADSKGSTNYYAEEVLGGKRYFTAVYPDVAVSRACIMCHNGHKDSPRDDFKMDEVMGAVVIRIPLEI